ncbi:MAG: polysaccharide deacetylase family protein [Chitinophagales bacterium]
MMLVFLTTYIIPASASAKGVAVLVFHQVTLGPTNSVTMSPEDFTSTLQTLKQQGYNFIYLKDLHDYMAGNIQLPGKSVLITFDDGYQDVYKYAHPTLVKLQVPAVMFPVMMYYRSDYRLPRQFTPHLSTDDIKAMQASGLWDFGGHSFDAHHQILCLPYEYGPFYTSYAWLGRRQETQLEYINRIEADLTTMTRTLSTLSLPVTDFAPPTGAINGTLRDLLSKNGIRYIYRQGNYLNYPGSNTLYRITVSSPEQVIKDLNNLYGNEVTPVIPGNNSDSPDITTLKEYSLSLKHTIYNQNTFYQGGMRE